MDSIHWDESLVSRLELEVLVIWGQMEGWVTDQGEGGNPFPTVFPHCWIPSAKGASFYIAPVRMSYLFIIPTPDGEP